jgi:hypothetical protein
VDLRGKSKDETRSPKVDIKIFNSTHLYGTESVLCAAHKVFSEII